MKVKNLTIIGLALTAWTQTGHAQAGTSTQTTNPQNTAPQAQTSYGVQVNAETQRNFYDDLLIEANGEHRRLVNGDYLWMTQGGASALYSLSRHDYVGVSLGFGAFQLKPGSFADFVARQPFYLEPGIVARHYFTSPHAILRPYAAANASAMFMIWDYRNPITVHHDTIHTDYLEGLDASAGFGFTLRLNENCYLFAEGDAGGIVTPCETARDVHNNFFANSAYIGAKGGLSFSF